MNVVRNLSLILIFMSMTVMQSCLQLEPTVEEASSDLNQKFQGTGKSFIFNENPIIASGQSNLSVPSMKSYVTAKFVTNNSYLEDTCTLISKITPTFSTTTSTDTNCFEVKKNNDPQTPLIPALNGGWGYSIGSDEFYEVNTFYHARKFFTQFLSDLKDVHNRVHFESGVNYAPSATKVDYYLTKSFWLNENATNQKLKIFSKCVFDKFNAYFSPSDNTVCLGWTEEYDFLHAAQDPSVIYHELGHVLVKIMMNQRNTLAYNTLIPTFHSPGFDSNLGSIFYDEAGSLNEGIADYFSYYINGREAIGEWALGRYYDGARPLQESHHLHTADLEETEDKRLSYPQYVYYDSYNKTKNVEDVHYAGQIVSHYLVSLTKKLKNTCTFATNTSGLSNSEYKRKEAGKLILLLLNESLAEIGDLTARGSDLFDTFRIDGSVSNTKLFSFFTNLNPQESYLWTQQVNPPNFRRFFQIFAKNILFKVSPSICPAFTQDESEKLLDSYGLLLFKSYENDKEALNYTDEAGVVTSYIKYSDYNGSSTTGFSDSLSVSPFGSTQVNEINRRKSILVSKDFISTSPSNSGQAVAYVFDKRSDIEGLLSSLRFKGEAVQTTENLAGVQYNNNNVKISPGEVLALTLNLYNNSNSSMAGVQVLANDWDHMKLFDSSYDHVNRNENVLASNDIASWVPCQIDGWPLLSEGAVSDSDDTVDGNCARTTRSNYIIDPNSSEPIYYKDASQPICMVQYSDENETKWVSQDFYRNVVLGLEDNSCLNNPSMSYDSFNPNECLIRFLPSANQAVLGRVDPQKSYAQTLIGTSTDHEGIQSNSAVIMEVNKLINPGTVFSCRFRTRFTNCSDCYVDANGDEYKDYEYAGSKPFKVLNFQFAVEE